MEGSILRHKPADQYRRSIARSQMRLVKRNIGVGTMIAAYGSASSQRDNNFRN
jgi:hypothetical protein